MNNQASSKRNILLSTKIFAGFGFVVFLLIGMATYSVLGVSSIGHLFTEYRSLARANLSISELQRNMMHAKEEALLYQHEPDPTHIEAFEKYSKAAIEAEKKAIIRADAGHRQRLRCRFF